MSIETAAEAIRAKIATGSSIGSTVKFDCGDEGAVFVDGETVSNENKDADCTILCDLETLEGLISGEVNATSAFMMGQIKVEGDMSVAMQLSSIL